ncbi:MAG: peptidylprolyl isomerase [Gemmatales bacterium]|nr:peptidylprolyl isomerase [Gemmatales bacterium]MDW7994476.1 peptidylprolyl isomerase [Gemmatales bacterium]
MSQSRNPETKLSYEDAPSARTAPKRKGLFLPRQQSVRGRRRAWVGPAFYALVCTTWSLAFLLPDAAGQNQELKPAAIVNGQPIHEKDVQRALARIPPEHRAKVRQEILDRLIDNALLDQHLIQLKIPSPPEEVQKRYQQIREEVKRSGHDFAKLLQELSLTESELQEQIAADLRWERYVESQLPEPALRKFFEQHPEWFDGTTVQARHILIACPTDADAQKKQSARQKAENLRQSILAEMEKRLAQSQPANAQERQTLQARLLTEVFAEWAIKHSECPSKTRGGDLGSFPRIGIMVEPFAAAAFSLPVGQVSPPIETPFGYHLILVTAKQPGRAVKFEDVKDAVLSVLAEQLREQLVRQLRAQAQIRILPVSDKP